MNDEILSSILVTIFFVFIGCIALPVSSLLAAIAFSLSGLFALVIIADVYIAHRDRKDPE